MMIRRGHALLLLAVVFAGPAAHGQWPQWGGANRDFKTAATGLATEWPEGGPPTIWKRELGDGYSTIVGERNRLYTMYRAKEKEIVVSLDAKTGDTIWEYAYESSPSEGHADKYGRGPRATPLLTGERLYTIGVAGMMHCLDARSGVVLWSHDLAGEFGANLLEGGYASSPIEYKDTIIVLSGGKNQALVAFQKLSGEAAWKGQSFEPALPKWWGLEVR